MKETGREKAPGVKKTDFMGRADSQRLCSAGALVDPDLGPHCLLLSSPLPFPSKRLSSL